MSDIRRSDAEKVLRQSGFYREADLIQSQAQRIEALEEENRTLKSFVRGEVNIIPVDTTKADEVKNEQKTK